MSEYDVIIIVSNIYFKSNCAKNRHQSPFIDIIFAKVYN